MNKTAIMLSLRQIQLKNTKHAMWPTMVTSLKFGMLFGIKGISAFYLILFFFREARCFRKHMGKKNKASETKPFGRKKTKKIKTKLLKQ